MLFYPSLSSSKYYPTSIIILLCHFSHILHLIHFFLNYAISKGRSGQVHLCRLGEIVKGQLWKGKESDEMVYKDNVWLVCGLRVEEPGITRQKSRTDIMAPTGDIAIFSVY